MHESACAVFALSRLDGRFAPFAVNSRRARSSKHQRQRSRRIRRYLESKTVEPERGDYYLSPTGEPTQAPGRWLSSPETLAALGIEHETVEGRDFIALMEGRHPKSGEFLRRAGADGTRGGGIDLAFSAPKSVSATWALSDEATRVEIESAHAAAADRAMAYLRDHVPRSAAATAARSPSSSPRT